MGYPDVLYAGCLEAFKLCLTTAFGQKQTINVMTSSVQLEFHFDADLGKIAHGELFVSASCGFFSGRSSAWFTCAELSQFGYSLRDTFPIPAGQSLQLAGGQFSADGTVVERMQVCLRASPLGGAGVVAINVELTTGDDKSRESFVKLSFTTTYEELRRFGVAVSLLADGSLITAELPGDD